MEEGTGDMILENSDRVGEGGIGEKINKDSISSFPGSKLRKQKDEAYAAGGDVLSSSAERTRGLRKRGGNPTANEVYNNLYGTSANTSTGFRKDRNNNNSPFGKTVQIQEENEIIPNTLMIDENEPGQNSFNYTYKYATDGMKDDRLTTNENQSPNRIKEYNTSSPYSIDQKNSIANPNLNHSRTRKIRRKSSLALGETTELEYGYSANNDDFNSSRGIDTNASPEVSEEERIRKENTNRAIFKTFLANTLRSEQLKYDTLQNKQL